VWGLTFLAEKTAVAGRIKHELVCTPVQNAETEHILNLRAMEALRPKATTKVVHYLPDGVLNQEEGDARFQGFVVCVHIERAEWIAADIGQKTAAAKPDKVKKMQNKTARMPQNELMDMLDAAFKRYTYWSMKALRQEIKQPEQYLRETLEMIGAELHKSGRFANHWALRQRMDNPSDPSAAAAEVAPDANVDDDFDMDGEEDDADIKMEDVDIS
jgi:transcription initiation factor TFIIF subunit beta